MGLETAFEVGRLYLQIKRIADALVASQQDVFVRLPGLVGYWPMGMRAAGSVTDHTGNGFTLTQTGINPVGYDGNSFSHLGNGTNYVSNSSAQLGLSGLETWISSSIRGLTIGGWFMLDAFNPNSGGLISKDALAPNRGYYLAASSVGAVTMSVSVNGSAQSFVTSPVVTISQWHFLVGRFTPGTEVAVFTDGDKTTNSTAIAASCNASTGGFNIGRFNSNDTLIQHCKSRDVFVCASALSDALIEEIRNTSAP